MPVRCTFKLNRQPMSMLHCAGIAPMKAFSGKEPFIDDPDGVTTEGIGPIPPGTYYIIDRQSGGRLGFFKDMARDEISHGIDAFVFQRFNTNSVRKWFMLWNPMTGDETRLDGITRGHFRLHPKGIMGISEGCVVVEDWQDFDRLQRAIRSYKATIPIPGHPFRAYGTLEVQE